MAQPDKILEALVGLDAPSPLNFFSSKIDVWQAARIKTNFLRNFLLFLNVYSDVNYRHFNVLEAFVSLRMQRNDRIVRFGMAMPTQ